MKNKIPKGYDPMCLRLINVRSTIRERTNAKMRLYLGGFVVIKTSLLTDLLPENHFDARNATAMNP